MLKIKNANIYNTEKRHFEFSGMIVENGIITEIKHNDYAESVDLEGLYIIPGMVDVHTHGRNGYDFPYVDYKELIFVLGEYAKVGTTTLFPTVASYPVADIEKWIHMIKSLYMVNSGSCMANVSGIHLEGRYINPVRMGAHNLQMLSTLNATEIGHTLKTAEPMPVHVTYAPELDADGSFKKALTGTSGIGHSDATYEQAINSGVTSYTHLYNAMRPLHHREPGTVGAGLISDAYTEMICDGIHLHPAVVKLTCKVKSKDKIVLITDSGMATGLGDGIYSKYSSEVHVKDGRVLTKDGVIAGSTLNLFDGLKNCAYFCGIPLEEAIPYATINPAKMVGIDKITGSLEIGKRADFVVLKKDMETLSNVYVSGNAMN